MDQSSPSLLKLSLYETDFHAWLQTQISLLNNRTWQKIDVINLIEELED